jgi:hypothetical protein
MRLSTWVGIFVIVSMIFGFQGRPVLGLGYRPPLPIHLHHLTIRPDLIQRGLVDHEQHLEYTYFRPGNITFEEVNHLQHQWMVQFIPGTEIKIPSKCSTERGLFQGHSVICVMTYTEALQLEREDGIVWVGEFKPEYKFSKSLIVDTHARKHGDESYALKVNCVSTPPLDIWKEHLPEHTNINRIGHHMYVVSHGLPQKQIISSKLKWKETPLVVLSRSTSRAGTATATNHLHEDLHQVLTFLSEQSSVHWIEPHVPMGVLNRFASELLWGVAPSEVDAPNSASAPEMDGSGEIITIGDTGLDVSHCTVSDTSQGVPYQTLDLESTDTISLSHDHSKIMNYVRFVYNSGVESDFDDFENGHGTHVIASAVGKGEWEGTAPGAKCIVLDFGFEDEHSSYLYIPEDIKSGILDRLPTETHIFSVSWGTDVNTYTETARQMDAHMVEHDDFVILVANGNTGDLGPASVGTPATAKNVIAVGATYNTHASFVNAYARHDIWVEEGSVPFGDPATVPLFDAHNLAYFSSRGPTSDGRIKPDIVAPGSVIVSARAHNQCKTMARHGTSMATPLVAGLVAKLRQKLNNPSSALIKAYLAFAANPVPHIVGFRHDSSNRLIPYVVKENPTLFDQGHGLVEGVSNLQPFTLDRHVLEEGETFSECFEPTGEHFEVAVAWIDPVAPISAQRQLMNNIDLEVVYNNKRYYGNMGEMPDTLNNLEKITLPLGNHGPIQVLVHGTEFTGSQTQAFALVMNERTGGETECPTCSPKICRISNSNGWGHQHCVNETLGPCLFTRCDNGFVYEGGECVLDTDCLTSCAVQHGIGKSCGHGCHVLSCDHGYHMTVDNTCACEVGETQVCGVNHGIGLMTCYEGEYSECTVQACFHSFTKHPHRETCISGDANGLTVAVIFAALSALAVIILYRLSSLWTKRHPSASQMKVVASRAFPLLMSKRPEERVQEKTLTFSRLHHKKRRSYV